MYNWLISEHNYSSDVTLSLFIGKKNICVCKLFIMKPKMGKQGWTCEPVYMMFL